MRVRGGALGVIAIVLGCLAHAATAEATSFTDRAAFDATLVAAGLAASTDTFETYSLGDIPNGGTRGSFQYSFDPGQTQPAVASDGAGGQALGGSPFDVFVGGDSVTLTFTGATPLRAFGADYFYAPNFEPLPGDLYQLGIADGAAAGTTVGNPPGLDASGGSFFLGFIEDTGSAFRKVDIFSTTPLDASGNPYLDPAYQVDNLTFAAPAATGVPEPASLTLALAALGFLAIAAGRRALRR
ncbi:MAG TPA: PEP-CTERM sorting domain-containing protein [Gaiellales bacterium]|nr:PEP-CTERM sorting domain-containing protein [Gaiellales bacterium]